MTDYQRLDDLLKRAQPYLPVAVDLALRAEILALRQQARDARTLRVVARRVLDAEVYVVLEGPLRLALDELRLALGGNDDE